MINITPKQRLFVNPRQAFLCSSLMLGFGLSACGGDSAPVDAAITVPSDTIATVEIKESSTDSQVSSIKNNDVDCPIRVGRDCHDPLSVNAADLFSRVGKVKGTGREASPGTAKGFLTFGPYATLKAGNYGFTLNYGLEAPSDLKRSEMDSYSIIGVSGEQTTIFKKGQLNPSSSTLKLDVELAEDVEKVQFRVFYSGLSTLSVNDITIEAKP